MQYPKRLIEVDLPIARISEHARRDKTGSISTLHIRWARRPLAACRAVICAALWPDPADPLSPDAFLDRASQILREFAERVYPPKLTQERKQLQSDRHSSSEARRRWERMVAQNNRDSSYRSDDDQDAEELRIDLLNFLADFSNRKNSGIPVYLETCRALPLAAQEELSGIPGMRPLVADPFAGGGSIPLEVLRVGADSFASDLNPVPVLLNTMLLEYIS